MVQVKFYEQNEKNLRSDKIKFAVILAKYKEKWVFCKHKARKTYECPGGHREKGEDIILTAERELYEETGALEYCLRPISIYSVYEKESEKIQDSEKINVEETFGMLFFAEIKIFGKLPEMEIEKVELFEQLPKNWTYPFIQPYLFEEWNKMTNRLERK